MGIQEIIGFATVPLYTVLPVCSEMTQGVYPGYMKAYAGLNLFYCSLTVALYATMLATFYCQQKFSSGKEAWMNDLFVKQQLAIMPAIKLMTSLYFMTGIMAEIFINTGIALPRGEPAFILSGIGTTLKVASSMVEELALFIRSTKFRECGRALLRGGSKDDVTTFSTHGAMSQKV